LTESKEASKVR